MKTLGRCAITQQSLSDFDKGIPFLMPINAMFVPKVEHALSKGDRFS